MTCWFSDPDERHARLAFLPVVPKQGRHRVDRGLTFLHINGLTLLVQKFLTLCNVAACLRQHLERLNQPHAAAPKREWNT